MTDLLEIKLAFMPISDDPERDQIKMDEDDEDEDEDDEEDGDEDDADEDDELGSKKTFGDDEEGGLEE